MAENENILTRLGKLFQSNIIVRKTPSGQVKVKDINLSQNTPLVNNFIDRYSKLMTNSANMDWAGKRNHRTAYETARLELFRDYESMDSDPIISSALDIYSDESTVNNVENEILNIRTDNPKIAKILHNLFYDILNVEFNLWSWIRNLSKYGDFFLKLDIIDKHGIVNVTPLSI